MKNKKQSDTNRVALRFCSDVKRATCKTQLSRTGRAAKDRSGDEDAARDAARDRGILLRARWEREQQKRGKNRYTTVTSIAATRLPVRLDRSLTLALSHSTRVARCATCQWSGNPQLSMWVTDRRVQGVPWTRAPVCQGYPLKNKYIPCGVGHASMRFSNTFFAGKMVFWRMGNEAKWGKKDWVDC